MTEASHLHPLYFTCIKSVMNMRVGQSILKNHGRHHETYRDTSFIEGRAFLFHPHTNSKLFFLLTINYHNFDILKKASIIF